MGFTDIKNAADSPQLVRRVKEFVTFIAPMTESVPDTMTDANGALVALPAGYWPLGLQTKEGFERTIDAQFEDDEAYGYSEPVRRDLEKAPSTLKVAAKEFGRRKLLELQYGLDLSTIEQMASGEVVFDTPPMPVFSEMRLVRIGRDIDPKTGLEWLLVDAFPRVQVAKVPDDSWKSGEWAREFEFAVLFDPDLGTACRKYIGGTAPKSTAIRTALGFAQAV